MKTRILKVVKPNVKVLKEVIDVLKNGGLIIYPTETCYGIGTDATNNRSIEKIYEIKGRDPSKPIPILVSSLNMIKKYGEITKKTEFLVNKFMPGPLSIIIKKKRLISDVNKNSVSFRISSHPVASLLVKLLKNPITTTSANLSGESSIYEISKIIENFKDKVDIILDCGDLSRVEPSTCIDMSSDDVKIIREGPIPSGLILKELKKRS
jgi:L-threonylcarbamoyladenylate synthase